MNLIVSTTIDKIKNNTDLGINDFLFGIKNFSTNFGSEITLDELKKINNEYPNINLFISLNKNIFNHELKEVEDILMELANLKVKAVLYYDLGILHLVRKNKINVDLVWNQTHMVTNYKTCNFYHNLGVKYGYLSTEITLDEMIEIANNTKMELLVTLVGHPIVSHSNRKLLSNYFIYNNEDDIKEEYTIEEKKLRQKYLVKESEIGTSVIDSQLLNGAKALFELKKNNISYGIIYQERLSDEQMKNIILLYQNVLKGLVINQEEVINKAEEILESKYTGFFYKKTIFKVKK